MGKKYSRHYVQFHTHVLHCIALLFCHCQTPGSCIFITKETQADHYTATVRQKVTHLLVWSSVTGPGRGYLAPSLVPSLSLWRAWLQLIADTPILPRGHESYRVIMCNSDNSSLHNLLIAKTRQKHNKYMKATLPTHYYSYKCQLSFFCSPLQRQKSAWRLIWQPGGLGLSLSPTAPSNPSCSSFRSRPGVPSLCRA